MQDYLESQDKEALLVYAASLGADVDSRFNISTIKNKITDKVKVKSAHVKDAVMSKNRNMKTIIIHKTEGKIGNKDITVSVNGRVFLMKRGVKVRAPDFVVSVLNNAVKTVYEYIDEETPLEARDVHSYPFSIVS